MSPSEFVLDHYRKQAVKRMKNMVEAYPKIRSAKYRPCNVADLTEDEIFEAYSAMMSNSSLKQVFEATYNLTPRKLKEIFGEPKGATKP